MTTKIIKMNLFSLLEAPRICKAEMVLARRLRALFLDKIQLIFSNYIPVI